MTIVTVWGAARTPETIVSQMGAVTTSVDVLAWVFPAFQPCSPGRKTVATRCANPVWNRFHVTAGLVGAKNDEVTWEFAQSLANVTRAPVTVNPHPEQLRLYSRSMLSFAGIKPIRECLYGLTFADERKRTRWMRDMRRLGERGD